MANSRGRKYAVTAPPASASAAEAAVKTKPVVRTRLISLGSRSARWWPTKRVTAMRIPKSSKNEYPMTCPINPQTP